MTNQDLSRLTIDRTATAQRPRRSRRVLTIGAVTAVIVAIIVALNASRPVPVEPTTVAFAYPSQNLSLLNATGYVVAQRKAALSSKGTGRLEWLGVLEGSKVKEGEVIARLENKDVMASLEQAQANVRVAEANLQQGEAELQDAQSSLRRTEELLAQHYVAPSALDTAQARFRKAKAAISGFQAAIGAARATRQAAQVALDQTMIRAPFDGVVLTKNANVGDNITPFSAAVDSKGAVVTIADMETLEVEADVSESSLAKIQVGQACEIQLDAFPDRRYAGLVSRLVPTVDRSKATLLAKVRFVQRDAGVLPEMSAKVAFLSRELNAGENTPVLTVDPKAIVKRDGKDVVFVIEGERVKMAGVTPGVKIGERVAVAGVQDGQKVVLSPGSELKDGSKISLPKK